jgi:hypothetical protein
MKLEIELNSHTQEALEKACDILGLDKVELVPLMIEMTMTRSFLSPKDGSFWLRDMFEMMEFKTLPEAEGVMDDIKDYEQQAGLDPLGCRFLMHRNPAGLWKVDREATRQLMEKVKAETEALRKEAQDLRDRRREAGGGGFDPSGAPND